MKVILLIIQKNTIFMIYCLISKKRPKIGALIKLSEFISHPS